MKYMVTDYHMHLEVEGLKMSYLRRFVEQAEKVGVDEIGISEHAYHFVEAAPLLERPDYIARRSQGLLLDDYVRLIEDAKAAGLPVKLGIEMDYIPEREDDIRSLMANYPWDYVIGSVHWLGEWGFDLDAESWVGRDVSQAYADYFRLAEMAIRSGIFDIFAHPDLIKIYGYRLPPEEAHLLDGYFDRMAEAARDAGICLEVSSAGLRKPVGEIYPDQRLLVKARALGVPISLASDAHQPEHVGWAYPELFAWARAAGYTTHTVFNRREKSQAPIPA